MCISKLWLSTFHGTGREHAALTSPHLPGLNTALKVGFEICAVSSVWYLEMLALELTYSLLKEKPRL